MNGFSELCQCDDEVHFGMAGWEGIVKPNSVKSV